MMVHAAHTLTCSGTPAACTQLEGRDPEQVQQQQACPRRDAMDVQGTMQPLPPRTMPTEHVMMCVAMH